jgi:TonB family protein
MITPNKFNRKANKGCSLMNLNKMLYAFALCCLTFEPGSFCKASAIAAESVQQQSLPAAGPYVVGNGVQPPVPLVQPLPPYTVEARKARIEGIVVLQAIIRKDGTVDSFKLIRGLGYGLDESAINTIASKWHFKPGTLGDTPVDVVANIEVRFRMFDPLYAIIIEPHWERSPDGTMNGSGYGNLKNGSSLRGFTYACSCNWQFEAGSHEARWIAATLRLEITSHEIGEGNANNPQKCALNVTMQDFIYEIKEGAVVTSPIVSGMATEPSTPLAQSFATRLATMPITAAAPAAIPADQQSTKEQLAKLFELMRVRDQVASLTKTMPALMQQQVTAQMKQMQQSNPEIASRSEEQQQAFTKVMNKYLERTLELYTPGEMISDLTGIYQKYLTRSDVDGIIAFYSSLAGQHLLNMQPSILQEYLPLAMQRMQDRTKVLTDEMQKEIMGMTRSQAPSTDKPAQK